MAFDLQREIAKALQKYGDDVANTTKAVGEAVAKRAVQRLKMTGSYKDRTGKYRKSFRVKTESSPFGSVSTVYSASPDYRLTHLLENGHMTRDGTKRVKAFPHWKPVEEEAVAEFESTLVSELNKIK